MKKVMLLLATVMSSATVLGDDDIIENVKELNEVVVKGVKAQKDAPFAVTEVTKEKLETFAQTGQELPVLFSRTPGVMSWSENGLGTGTVYMRIRGAADSRINVTLDGVPLNSPEDQCVFWANMNSYSALLGNAQIQRGVGTSTNGDGAFGGTISLTSKAPNTNRSLELNASYGSYNTYNLGGSFSTGLIGKHFIFDGAYHETNTDGYIDGTGGRSGSYYGGLSWLDDKFIIRYKNFGNFEKTGQAWHGVIAGDYDGYLPLNLSYSELYKRGMGKWNSLVSNIYTEDYETLKNEPYKMNDGSLWAKTTDNFWQNHNILTAAWKINDNIKTSVTLHYTHGYGYYREFKYNNKFSKYGLENFTRPSDGKVLKKTDFVREKGLTQDAFGAIWNINYTNEKIDFVGGVNYQSFIGNHFGYLTYMGDKEAAAHYLKNGKLQYYDSDASKHDISGYAKVTTHLNTMWDVFGDLQYRFVKYKTDGYNDKYYGAGQKHYLDVNENYNFFNPKAGVMFHNGGNKAFFSLALSNREPERNNFTDNGKYGAPKAERLLDFELGYEYNADIWYASANLYYMYYHNQFVQTGELSDIGEALTTNIPTSYRLGAELMAGVNVCSWLNIEANASLSVNKLKDFTEIITENYDEDWNPLDPYTHTYSSSTLAYSPSAMGNVFVNAHYKGFQATWHTSAISSMYLDNTASDDRKLPGYSVSNFSASYKFNIGKGVKELILGFNLNNIFNRHYAANGFVWYQSIVGGKRSSQLSYIPSAGTTCLGSVTVRF